MALLHRLSHCLWRWKKGNKEDEQTIAATAATLMMLMMTMTMTMVVLARSAAVVRLRQASNHHRQMRPMARLLGSPPLSSTTRACMGMCGARRIERSREWMDFRAQELPVPPDVGVGAEVEVGAEAAIAAAAACTGVTKDERQQFHINIERSAPLCQPASRLLPGSC